MKRYIQKISVVFMICILWNAAVPTAASVLRPEEDPAKMLPANRYELENQTEVNGRQGVCCEGECYWVSGSATLARYDITVLFI